MSERPDEALPARAQGWLDRLRGGDLSARDALLEGTSEKLVKLARKMLRDSPGVGRFEQTDDVFQSAMVRLWRMLDDLVPATPADYSAWPRRRSAAS